jgi:HK97 family phage major capsid protein
MLEFLKRQLRELAERRAALSGDAAKIVAAADAEKRGLTTEETTNFDGKLAEVTKVDDEIRKTEARIAEVEEQEKRAGRAAEIVGETRGGDRQTGGATVTREPMTYERGNGNSYFLDLARAQLQNNAEARARLDRHAAELRVELPKREARRDEAARREVRSIEGVKERHAESAFEKRVNPNRTDGQGGYFVPPLWLVDEYIELPRFGRPFANAVRNFDLPSGTDSVNLPKVSTGTATGVQTSDGASVTSTDLTDTFVTAPVRTIAGQQDVAMQLLDQSPTSFDQVVFTDLIADYNVQVDTQCISGSGSAGQVTGVLNASSINTVTYTDASVTLPEMWPSFAQAASLVAKNRKLPALATFMIPSIWYWITGQLDTSNRPFVQIEPGSGFNILALQTGVASEGPVGRIMGLPVLMDGNIPTNLGAGTNESRLITARTSDIYLWEGSLRTRVLTEVLSGTLQVRFQVYNYVAFMPDRLPKAIAVVSGTGIIPQSGY